MYSFRELRGRWYVIHNKTGCSIPYSNGKDQVIPDYKEGFLTWESLTRKGRKRMKKINSLFAGEKTTSPWKDLLPREQEARAEKETAMCTTYANTFAVSAAQGDTRTEAQQAKDYLIASLNQEINTKSEKLHSAFGLDGDFPRTVGDLKKYLENGWVKVSNYAEDAFDDDERIYGVTDYLVFENPDHKEDRTGYRAAEKAMREEASAVKDQIVVFGPEKGLEALNEFKAKDFSKQ